MKVTVGSGAAPAEAEPVEPAAAEALAEGAAAAVLAGIIRLLGLRSPCPLTTGSSSASKRLRILRTSEPTAAAETPRGSAAPPTSIWASISSMKCQSTTGAPAGRRTEWSAASRGASARRTPRCAAGAWMSLSVSVRPEMKSVTSPSEELYSTRGPRPSSDALASAAPRMAGVSLSLASGEKSLATTVRAVLATRLRLRIGGRASSAVPAAVPSASPTSAPSTEAAPWQDAGMDSGGPSYSQRYTQLQNPALSSSTRVGTPL
mmetsp:Transcript_45867/g.147700  ORF Transcript_45867/g.147700 Transcript_45867/m.147700 type:complete len:262 (-) Transcript_45867:193-978(-)